VDKRPVPCRPMTVLVWDGMGKPPPFGMAWEWGDMGRGACPDAAASSPSAGPSLADGIVPMASDAWIAFLPAGAMDRTADVEVETE
jgi:hypothetical protein